MSSMDTGAGSNPEWNETFVFNVSDNVSELIVKIMDSDTFSKDDFVGEAKWVFIISTHNLTYNSTGNSEDKLMKHLKDGFS